jgi:hypothetical protein
MQKKRARRAIVSGRAPANGVFNIQATAREKKSRAASRFPSGAGRLFAYAAACQDGISPHFSQIVGESTPHPARLRDNLT